MLKELPIIKIMYDAPTSNEEVTLYPVMPEPRNQGFVRMYTEQRLLAENLKVILHFSASTKNNSILSGDASAS